MSNYLAQYMKRGLSEIVILRSHDAADSSTHKVEWIEEVVARKRTGFVRVTVNSKTNFFRSSGSSCDFDEEPISENEYESLRSERPIIDTTEARAAVEKMAALEKKLAASRPRCPKCKRKLILKNGKNGQFWGCANYPECRESRPFSERVRRLSAEIEALKKGNAAG
jgi:hypothetical protein